MNRRKATLGAAVVGVTIGAVALGLVAAPAGAGQSPALPPISPDALVGSVLAAQLPAMAGTIDIQNNLGLPALPGLPMGNGTDTLRAWTDGAGRSRLSLPTMTGERVMVDDGATVYLWNSNGRTVSERPRDSDLRQAGAVAKGIAHGFGGASLDPATAAMNLLASIRATSDITVDGTDMVANRPAYDLVLTPKPDERTLLREVRISVDAQSRIPLGLSVLGNNTNTPVIQIGFSKLDLGPQDPALFHFTPPANSTLVPDDPANRDNASMAAGVRGTVVGSGWDSVVVGHLPTHQSGGQGDDVIGLAQRFGTPVSGPWGSGWEFKTSIGAVVVTSDGRFGAGFVPEQLLTDALGRVK